MKRLEITELVTNLSGQKVERVKTSLIQKSAFACILIAMLLLMSGFYWRISILISMGSLLLATFVPLMLLYPIIRFLLGGKDSVLGLILTVVIEHELKQNLNKKLKNIARR